MIIIKDSLSIGKMREAGQRLAGVMLEIGDLVRVGVSTLEIDTQFEKKMRAAGLRPVCKGYAGYKHATCISLNDVVIHGVPSDKIVLKSGDFVKIDVV
ncbi:M24 family metallopeptidase, partial [Candidatus Babeliales bacterium]|nr:M24 family metallopeptidase [Candidatus Babeliales bacterium]